MAPKRGTRRSRNWVRVFPGLRFKGTDWTVVEGPYKRIKRSKVKSWVTVRCGHCQQEYERRLDHILGGKSHCCYRCSPHIHQPWQHWALARKKKKESMDGVVSITVPETDQNQEPEQELDLTQWPPRRRTKGHG
jgi:hypothetical protein